MSINFATLQGLTIPEGVVTQISDASGRVLWSAAKNIPAVLQVEKITSDTYAGETTYTGEQFVLLSITPRIANGTVKVTYGGLTKTLAFSGTNSQNVFFGTFNGVADSVATPESGTLTIEGDFSSYGIGTFKSSKLVTRYCSCVTDITEWGSIEAIGSYAFYMCNKLTDVTLPSGITSIGSYAFYHCENLVLLEIPEGVTSIGGYAFTMDYKSASGENKAPVTAMSYKDVLLPSTIQEIGEHVWSYYDASSYVSNLIILATTPPDLPSGSLYCTIRSAIIVPKGCGDAYKAAEGWSVQAHKIVEVS